MGFTQPIAQPSPTSHILTYNHSRNFGYKSENLCVQAPNTYATIGPGNAAHGGLKRILTATGGINDKTGSQQKLAPSTSSPSLDKIIGAVGATGGANLGSHRSSSSLLSLSSFNINSVYTKVSLNFGSA